MRRALFLLLLVSPPAFARVFWRQPVDLPSGWTRAYASEVDLQNGGGGLQVFSTPDRLEGVEARLRSLHGDNLAWIPGEVMAWALAVEDGWVYRYLAQPLPDGAGFWVTVLRQPARRAGKPGEEPRRHQLKALPAYPQSQPTFYSHDAGNRLTVEISRTGGAPEAALDILSEMLEADGWQASPGNTGGFRMFVRRDRVAFLGARRGKDGFTRVLRLHKPLGVK